MSEPITKYKFKLDGVAAVSALARTKALAVEGLLRLFGKDSKLEFTEEEFSHNVGDYESQAEFKVKKALADSISTAEVSFESKKEGIDSVIEEYAKHGKVDL